MAEGDYNPSYEGVWIDASGRLWRRKGKRGRIIEARRVRSLLRRDDVPLIIWRSFETTQYDGPIAKAAAVDELDALGGPSDDVVASEWRDEDDCVLLMLEQHC